MKGTKKRKSTIGDKLTNTIVALILIALAAALIYSAYLEMVSQGKADRIEVLRERLQKQTIETEKVAEERDSIILMLEEIAE
mgnify:CR=1 FL=1